MLWPTILILLYKNPWQTSMISPPLETTPAAQAASDQVIRSFVWRASELAISRATTVTTGYDELDVELPNKGWPRSSLVELLVEQHGIGEMQLLKPCLASLSQKERIAFVQPPYLPHAMTCRSWNLNDRNLLWLRPQSSADALWSAEQVLKNGSCGAVVIWQSNVRPESLRRLNLAAQSTDTWLWLVRPLAAAADASVSALRIALRPALGGVSADIIKRRGPTCETPIFVPLADMPAPHLPTRENETPIERAPTTTAPGVHASAMV